MTQKSGCCSSFTESKNNLATSVGNSRRPQWDGSVAHSIPVVQERLSGRKPRRNRRKVAVHPYARLGTKHRAPLRHADGQIGPTAWSRMSKTMPPRKFRPCGRRHFRTRSQVMTAAAHPTCKASHRVLLLRAGVWSSLNGRASTKEGACSAR